MIPDFPHSQESGGTSQHLPHTLSPHSFLHWDAPSQPKLCTPSTSCPALNTPEPFPKWNLTSLPPFCSSQAPGNEAKKSHNLKYPLIPFIPFVPKLRLRELSVPHPTMANTALVPPIQPFHGAFHAWNVREPQKRVINSIITVLHAAGRGTACEWDLSAWAEKLQVRSSNSEKCSTGQVSSSGVVFGKLKGWK